MTEKRRKTVGTKMSPCSLVVLTQTSLAQLMEDWKIGRKMTRSSMSFNGFKSIDLINSVKQFNLVMF